MKKQHYFLFWTWLIAFALSLPLHAQTQIGQDIDGEREDDKSGTSVSLSADGTILAIGAIYNRVGGDAGGHVRVYQWNGTTWMKLGADIDGMEDERYGNSVSLSANGKILAIGAPNYGGFRTGKGGVRVHQWDASTLAWVRLGADIEGEAADDDFGTSVSLSANGTKLAIGAFRNDGNGGDAGHVRVYQWNGTAMAWEQQGTDIDGEATGDASGYSVSLSADGTKLAIGAYSNDDNGNRAGHVRVYQWNSTTMAWQQQGGDINGKGASDDFGKSVSLSADGNKLAIGSVGNYVQVYQWNGTAMAWEQQGTDINGSNGFGSAVSLSAGGTRLAIGAYYESSPTGASEAGQVKVYQWNGTAWAQQGVDIYGEAAYDHSGTSVSLSADGSKLAIGAPDNDGTDDDAGHVRVYEACPRVATTTETMTWNGSSNTDWNSPCNWSPNGVPTATNAVIIPDVANDPIVPTNLAAVAKSILFQDGNPTLTVQSNATLTVTGTVVNLVSVTVTNSGTITTAGFRSENNTPPFVQTLTFLNQSTGVVNGSFFTSGGFDGSFGAIRLTNHGTINYSGSDRAILLNYDVSTFNNYGTINITGGTGIAISGGKDVNHACGKILLSAGEFFHRGSNDFLNYGLVQVAGGLKIFSNERFVNHGVVKYGRLTSGGIKNTEGIIVHDTVPIFTYGSASQDTVKGIFIDADATLSAGTFTAPNTFMPLASLLAGSQTLYAKITPGGVPPSGGTCSFVVPFNYTPRPFITTWNLATAGSGATQLSFGVATAGTVDYTWTTVPAGTSGSGTFSGTTATITGLPAGATIELSIAPANFQRFIMNNGTDKSRLIDIKQWGDVAWTSMLNAFYGCNNMTMSATDVPNTANVTDMGLMFNGCSAYNQALPTGFNTANVTNMNSMFQGCSAYNQALPAGFNTANVTNMEDMFLGCSAFNQALPAGFNTAKVTYMTGMFSGCSAYNQALPAGFNTAKVRYMRSMFNGCSAYNQALPAGFNTANVTDMNSMFQGCNAYNQALPAAFNTAMVTDMVEMFDSCIVFNQVLPVDFNTAKVTNMFAMFRDCHAFNQALPAAFTTATVTNMNQMFSGATAFNQNIGHLDISKAVVFDLVKNSGIDQPNYDALLTAWNTAGYTNKNLRDASPLKYCTAAADRANLVKPIADGGKGWTITGDALLCTNIIYVNHTRPDNSGDGYSWATAKKDVQAALTLATSGKEIWVAKGTYKPTADGSGNTTPTDPRDKTFVLKDGVKLYGSFAGTETTLSERTPAVMAANPAILSGDFGDNDVVAGSGSTLSITGNGENAYHVVVVAFINTTPTAYLDGFTITGGNANGSGTGTINRRLIDQSNGGGISIYGGSNTLSNNTIFGNRASGFSGGIDNNVSNTTLTNNTIARNSAVQSGGGIYNKGSNTTLTNNTIIGNLTFSNGGGIVNQGGNHTLTNNTISGNKAFSFGGGISSAGNTNNTLTNNTISENSARSGGGIFSGSDVNITLTNNTIIGNNADSGGGGIYIDGITTITNTIIWGNTRHGTIIDNVEGTLTITYSIVQGGYTGTGNKDQDPLFVNAADIDGADNIHRTADDGLRLLACSPAVNGGNNAGIPSGITTDIIDNARIFNTTVDMGAYELQANPSTIPTITLGSIPAICAGATAFTIPYTATTGTPTTYSISGTGITAVTDATLPTGAITVNLSAAASGTTIPFTLTVRNASGCTSANITGSVTVNSNTTPSVSIDPTAICAGTSTMLTATATNGGSSPQFYWTKNNINIPAFLNIPNPSGALGINDVYVSSGGTIYMATNGAGLGISTDGGATFSYKTATNGLGGGANTTYGVYVGNDGTIYVATAGGVSISSDGGATFSQKTTANGLGSFNVYDVYVGSNGTIYASTFNGLSISTNGGMTFSNKTQSANGLGSNAGNDVYVDNAGVIYAATNGGLSISTDGGMTFSNKTQSANGLGSNQVLGVYVDNAGTIYAATGGGLSISTDGGASFSNKSFGSVVRGVYVDNAGTIYAATGGGLSISRDGGTSFINKTKSANGLVDNLVLGVYVDNAGTIYAATAGGLSIIIDNTLPVTSAVAGDVYEVRLVPSAEVCSNPATATASVTVSANTTITSVSLTQPTCAVPTGTAIVRTLNSNTLEFSKDNMNWQADSTFSGLPPGNYTFYARRTASPTCVGSSAQTINPVPACSRVIYVNAANTNPTQNGTSWSTAFSQLTAGLSAAAAVSGVPVEVWVARGTYKPGSLRRDVFTIPSGVKVYGGFVGNENLLSLRNPKNNLTVLSGEIGSAAQRSDNTYHVVVFDAANDQTRIDGFQIQRGYAEFFAGSQNTNLTAPQALTSGGGILAINKSKATISNCVIADNKATFGGGIMLRDSSHLLIAQTIIWGNEATFGGGIYVLGGSKPRIENVLIVSNKGLGGGLYVNASQPTLIHCTLASNLGTNGTAGAVFNANATTTLRNSILWGNSAPQSTNGSLITYSIVEGGFVGTGNRNQDPRFVNHIPVNLALLTGLGDYHLLPCSPAIDAANNPDGLPHDLDGNPRPFPSVAGIVDMGAYESSGAAGAGPATLTVTAPITSGTVLKTAGRITATNQVSGATVVYQGSQSVTLLPGFSANGNTFQAIIGDCQTSAVTGSDSQK